MKCSSSVQVEDFTSSPLENGFFIKESEVQPIPRRRHEGVYGSYDPSVKRTENGSN